MRQLKSFMAVAAIAAGLAMATLPAAAQVYYTINGQPVTAEVQAYMAANGLPLGHYWLDDQGYWGMVGNPNPIGNIYAGSYAAGSGSGEQAPNGWTHYNPNAGYWVGGDANGCVYTPDWSNC